MKHSYLDQYSCIDSGIHRLDPRVKILVTGMIILSVIFTDPREVSAFIAYFALIMALILTSKIPVRSVIVKSTAIIPFVVMIGVFIPFMKQGSELVRFSLGGVNLAVTREGALIFWNACVKAFISMLAMILLTATTKFTDLLKALELLRFPRVFIMVLSFFYRYVFLIVDEVEMMWRAKEARSIGGTKWFHVKVIANMIGLLFIRAYERGEKVYLAMCSKGFTGSVRTLSRLRIRAGDMVFFLLVSVLLVMIRQVCG
ncbi:MAG: cobalt ECF transporter T component CbiQ [Candidatus Omnitrophota bacterium]